MTEKSMFKINSSINVIKKHWFGISHIEESLLSPVQKKKSPFLVAFFKKIWNMKT